jgi:hypothetical protein
LTIFVAAALVGSVVTLGDNMVFANNHAEQGIEQEQWNKQNSQCVAAGGSSNGDDDDDDDNGTGNMTDDDDDNGFSGNLPSCNNVGLLFQENEGNLALRQE